MNLKNKTAVIIGATGGIGSEVAKSLDKEGADLILISKTLDKLSNLNNLLGKKHETHALDLTNQKKVEEYAKSFSKKIDLFVNCAGIGVYKQIEEISLDEWNDTFNIGLTSTFLIIREIIKNKLYAENALFVNIGSGMGVIPSAGRSLYCASKFALRGFALSLAEEFKRVGNPKFCLITLGSTLTEFGPMTLEEKKKDMESGKAYFTPEWVGNKLMEIIKDDNREVEYVLYPSDYGFGDRNTP